MTLYVNKSCPCLFWDNGGTRQGEEVGRGPDRLEAQAALQGREIYRVWNVNRSEGMSPAEWRGVLPTRFERSVSGGESRRNMFKGGLKFLQGKWFSEIDICTGFLELLHLQAAGDSDNVHAGISETNLFAQLKTGHSGHLSIGYDNIIRTLLQHFKSFHAVVCLAGGIAPEGDAGFQKIGYFRVIVND